MSAPWLGDYEEDETVHFLWSSTGKDGASIHRATDGEVRVYKDNGIAQSTAGVTDTENFDSLTGIHKCDIDLSADVFYVTGADYSVVLQGATIDGETVNAVLAHFSIENRYDGVDEIATGAITADAIATDAIGSSELAATAAQEIADQVWDEAIADHTTVSQFGGFLQIDYYQMKVWLIDDDNGGEDHYAVAFYKNGEVLTSGVTSPTLWVFSMAAAPADLVGTSGLPQSMTEAGSTETWFHDESSNRIVDGTAYMARVQATIGGATRTWYQPVSRDG